MYIPIVFLVIAVAMAIAFFSVQKGVRLYAAITHLLSFIFLCSLAGAISVWTQDMQVLHLVVLILFFLLGTWHTWSMYRFQRWSRREAYIGEVLFTLLILSAGSAGYLSTYFLVSGQMPGWYLAGAVLPFLLPFMVHKSFFLWRSIPDRIYYVWQYLENQDIDTPQSGETIMLYFRMEKKGNADYAKFAVKAPLDMPLGDVFHFLLHRYNLQHPDEPIMGNSRTSPFGWYFYVKDKWWKNKEAVNPNVSVYRNQLNEEMLIHAKRVYLGY